MLKELFRIPGLDIPLYSFGLMLVLGCWLAMELSKRLANRSGINGDHFVNIGVIALLSGIVGARASHVLENWHQYFGPNGEGFWAAINIRSGGLTYYGGVIIATPACIAYGLWNRIPLRRGMDIVAPALMIGLGIGRVGCFLNGCCWGATCDVPWAVQFPYDSPAYLAHVEEGKVPAPPQQLMIPLKNGYERPMTSDELRHRPELSAVAHTLHSAAVHPSQLYSTATALLIAGVLVAFYTLRPSPGRVFALMMILEGVGRYTIETLRIEPAVLHVGGYALSYSMVIGALLVPAGIVLWFVFPLFDRKGSESDRLPDRAAAQLT